ncbi:MAG TPA: class I SAM-dependent RNA methyltransferase [Gemmatimonadales bacterium]|nr:class I SAM-dependent RNA methyltransferase [Gemmatimonadales bacterium]
MPSPVSAYAITAPGIEAITARELTALGLPVTATEPGGVAFSATPVQLYAANLHSRTASRIIVRVVEFSARTFFELERHAKKVPWERFAAPGSAVSFRVTSRKSKLYHQGAIEERLARWAGERGFACRSEESRVKSEKAEVEIGFSDPAAGTPEDRESPFHPSLFTLHSQLFLIRLHRDKVTVSADSSGELLHRRGYRLATAKAPVRETLAAAMLLASGWDGSAALIDPLCGAGTIPIEGALIARNIAPGARRSFAFERWPEFDAAAWAKLREAALNGERATVNGTIEGADRDAGAIAASVANAERAGVANDITFVQRALDAWADVPSHRGGWLVTNPPYGVRVGEDAQLAALYATLGAVARQQVPGGQIGVLSADPRLDARIGLPLTERFAAENGGIGVRFVTGVVS